MGSTAPNLNVNVCDRPGNIAPGVIVTFVGGIYHVSTLCQTHILSCVHVTRSALDVVSDYGIETYICHR